MIINQLWRETAAFGTTVILLFAVAPPAVAAVGPMVVSSAAAGPAPDLPLFHPTITRIAVFKNGYVFTFRGGSAPVYGGWAETDDVPAGVLGTIWGYGTDRIHVTEMLATDQESHATRPAQNMRELLLLNEGGRVRVMEGDKEYEGVLAVLAPHPHPADPEGMDQPPMNTPVYDSTPFEIAVKSDQGVQVIDLSRVTHLELEGQPKWNVEAPLQKRTLALKLEGLKPGETFAPLGIASLERGIRWIPGYRVTLVGEARKQATVELEASVINDLADLQDTDFNFVVGVPHFLMSATLSPLSLRTAFTGLSPFFTNSGSGDEGMAMSQFAYGNFASSAAANGVGGSAPPIDLAADSLPILSAEQLFLYHAEHLSLKKGARASLRLFSITVPCTEVYEWTITDPPNQNFNRSQPTPGSNEMTSLEDRVWYSIRLKNTSQAPWTTGPATTFLDWKPMGQDMMPFTGAGGEAILKVTPATVIAGSHQQVEKSRQRSALTLNGNEYDLVTVEGTVTLRNITAAPVTLCLTRKTDGEISEASDGGKISREGFELQAINPHSVVYWELALPPGEKQITYTYHRYVPH